MKKLIKNIFLTLSLISLATFSTGFISKINNIENYNFQKTETIKIEGLYVLKTCEKSRFIIKIEKKDKIHFFYILDRKNIISKGKVKLIEDDQTYIDFGKMEGVLSNDRILIQNYGNSMNEYIHFTQCDEKYLTFEKVKQ